MSPVNEDDGSVEASKAAVAEAIGAARVVPLARRPVGRPRTTEAVPPVQTPTKAASKAVTVTEMPSKRADSPRQLAGEQEPVEWWVEGWNRRRK